MFEADEEPEEEALAAATAASPMMAPVAGFGSPVKFNESPAVSVSIGPAISAEASLRSGMRAMEEDGEVCSGSPAGEAWPGWLGRRAEGHGVGLAAPYYGRVQQLSFLTAGGHGSLQARAHVPSKFAGRGN